MHAADPEEQLPLLYQVPLQRVLNWNRWWHIVARLLLQAGIPEEILGSVREPPEDSHRCGQSTSSTGKIVLRTRTRPTAPAVERDRP